MGFGSKSFDTRDSEDRRSAADSMIGLTPLSKTLRQTEDSSTGSESLAFTVGKAAVAATGFYFGSYALARYEGSLRRFPVYAQVGVAALSILAPAVYRGFSMPVDGVNDFEQSNLLDVSSGIHVGLALSAGLIGARHGVSLNLAKHLAQDAGTRGIANSIVRLSGNGALGSGFSYNEFGGIMTAAHVAAATESGVTVRTMLGQVATAKYVAISPRADVAIAQLNKPLQIQSLGLAYDARTQEPLTAYGYPAHITGKFERLKNLGPHLEETLFGDGSRQLRGSRFKWTDTRTVAAEDEAQLFKNPFSRWALQGLNKFSPSERTFYPEKENTNLLIGHGDAMPAMSGGPVVNDISLHVEGIISKRARAFSDVNVHVPIEEGRNLINFYRRAQRPGAAFSVERAAKQLDLTADQVVRMVNDGALDGFIAPSRPGIFFKKPLFNRSNIADNYVVLLDR